MSNSLYTNLLKKVRLQKSIVEKNILFSLRIQFYICRNIEKTMGVSLDFAIKMEREKSEIIMIQPHRQRREKGKIKERGQKMKNKNISLHLHVGKRKY